MTNRPPLFLIATLCAPLLLSCDVPAEPLAEAEKQAEREPTAAELINRAEAAYRAGDGERALELADRAVEMEPERYRWRQYRGSLRFRLGKVAGSVEDFDRAVELAPRRMPHNWQRGIALYYAERYKEGREQFEEHRTVNPNDVENAAWHFLCVARQESPEAAREALLPVGPDSRVPMKVICRMFAGEAEPSDVIEAAKAGDSRPAFHQSRRFYAHLYIGLYLDATGLSEDALKHIRLAAEKFGGDHYMGDVAAVHLAHLEDRLGKRAGPPAQGDPEGAGAE